MKITCDVCRDLLLLYEDKLCSEDSRRLVEEHLETCADCRAYLEKMRVSENMAAEAPQPEMQAEKEAIRKSFRKIRLRWRLSLLTVLMLIPLAGMGVMACNEMRGWGIGFTNLDDLWLNWRFYSLLQDGEFARAAEYLTFAPVYQGIRESWDVFQNNGEESFFYEIYGDVPNMSLEAFEEQERQKMVAYWEENEPSIRKADYYYTYRNEDGTWEVVFTVVEDTDMAELPEVRNRLFFCGIDGKLFYSGSGRDPSQLDEWGIEYEEDPQEEEEWMEKIEEASHVVEAFDHQKNTLSRRINGLE